MRRDDAAPATRLTPQQKVAICAESALPMRDAVKVRDADITYDFLVKNNCNALGIIAAGVGPRILKERGVSTALQIRRLGFDALHLVDAKFAQELLDAFGADDCKRSFLTSPEDAVSIASTDAMTMFDVGVADLLSLCAGAPTAAEAVLEQMTMPDPLAGIEARILLDTGLRAAALQRLGYSALRLQSSLLDFNTFDVLKLGYKI